MKIFISQPMFGKTKGEIRKERNAAIQKLRAKFGKNVEILSSLISEPIRDEIKNKALYSLGHSINILARADACYFMRGWEDARGCRIEAECCKQYGMPLIHWQEVEG